MRLPMGSAATACTAVRFVPSKVSVAPKAPPSASSRVATGFKAEIVPDALLAASTTYTLTVEICDTSALTEFTTSEYGAPLSIDISELSGNTYNNSRSI